MSGSGKRLVLNRTPGFTYGTQIYSFYRSMQKSKFEQYYLSSKSLSTCYSLIFRAYKAIELQFQKHIGSIINHHNRKRLQQWHKTFLRRYLSHITPTIPSRQMKFERIGRIPSLSSHIQIFPHEPACSCILHTALSIVWHTTWHVLHRATGPTGIILTLLLR